MVSAADAEALRLAQAGIRELVERDIEMFFWSLPLDRPESARDRLLEFVPVLVGRYGADAGDFAADWYDTMRAEERTIVSAQRFRATPVESPYTDAVDGMVRRAAGDLFTDTPAAALTTLQPNVGKFVLAASRATITTATDNDPAARGWQRITRLGACSFCRMLEGRGGVYTRESVHFASHGDCNCASAPSWDPNAPEVDVRLYEASKRTTGMSEAQRAAHNARIREFTAAMD